MAVPMIYICHGCLKRHAVWPGATPKNWIFDGRFWFCKRCQNIQRRIVNG